MKILTAFHGKSMRQVFVELIERGLKGYQEKCLKNHEPNAVTRKALENAKNGKGLEEATSVEDLFKKLRQ